MIVLGDNEHHITFDELKKKAELGYDELYKAHAADWLNYFDFKPMFSAYAIHAVYKEWQKNPYANIMRYMDICVDVLKFWLSHLVKNGSDGLYYFAQIKDGGESGVDASIDSFTQLDFAKAFLYVGEMYSLFEYTDIGRKMLGALESNRRPDGYLASYKGSPYRFVSPLILYLPRRSCE